MWDQFGKRITALCCVLLFFICCLTIACGCRRENIIEHYSDTASYATEADSAGEEVTDDFTVPDDIRNAAVTYYLSNPYADMSKQDLEELYRTTHNVTIDTDIHNTPYYYIISTQEGGEAFSKLTGEFVPLCKDPVCDHTKCPFTANIQSLIVAEDKIYFLIDDIAQDKAVLYEADFHMDHIAIAYTWNRADRPNYLYYHDGGIYYSGSYRENGKTEKRVFVLNIEKKEVSLLEGVDKQTFKDFCFVADRYLYYCTHNADNKGDYIRRYDLDTGKDACVVPASILHPENGDLELILHHAEPDGIHLGMTIMRQGFGTAFSFEFCRYNIQTGEYVSSANGPLSGGYIAEYINHISKEFEDDPFYDYYVNNEGLSGKENKSGGELVVTERETGKFVGTLRFTTDGIPDNLKVDYWEGDGRFIYVKYSNYKAYANEMNPSYNSYEAIENPELASTFGGYMLIDVARLKVLDMGPENHQIEWSPEK